MQLNYTYVIYGSQGKKYNFWIGFRDKTGVFTQPAITCSKLAIKTLELGVKYSQVEQ